MSNFVFKIRTAEEDRTDLEMFPAGSEISHSSDGFIVNGRTLFYCNSSVAESVIREIAKGAHNAFYIRLSVKRNLESWGPMIY